MCLPLPIADCSTMSTRLQSSVIQHWLDRGGEADGRKCHGYAEGTTRRAGRPLYRSARGLVCLWLRDRPRPTLRASAAPLSWRQRLDRPVGSARLHPGDCVHDVDPDNAGRQSHPGTLPRDRGGLLHPRRRMPGALLGRRGELRHLARSLGPRLLAALPAARGVQHRRRRMPGADLACQGATNAAAICRPRTAQTTGGSGISATERRLPTCGSPKSTRTPQRGATLSQSASPAKIAFFRIAWTPQLASTTWVTPKSTATDISEIASSSESPLVVIRKCRILRNASRIARSSEDLPKISVCALSPSSAKQFAKLETCTTHSSDVSKSG